MLLDVNRINDKYFALANVTRLSTNNQSRIQENELGEIFLMTYPQESTQGYQAKHVYIVGNEKVNDTFTGWAMAVSKSDARTKFAFKCVLTTDFTCIAADAKIYFFEYYNIYPIISSTDEKLNVSRPSNAFISKYCNLEGNINEVLIECEDYIYNPETEQEYKESDIIHPSDCDKKYRPKLSPNNTIKVRPVETTKELNLGLL